MEAVARRKTIDLALSTVDIDQVPRTVARCLELVRTCHADLEHLITLRNELMATLAPRPRELERVNAVIEGAHRGLADVCAIVERCRPDSSGGRVSLGLKRRLRWLWVDANQFNTQLPIVSRQHAAVVAELSFLRLLGITTPMTDMAARAKDEEENKERERRAKAEYENLGLLGGILGGSGSGLARLPPLPHTSPQLTAGSPDSGLAPGQSQPLLLCEAPPLSLSSSAFGGLTPAAPSYIESPFLLVQQGPSSPASFQASMPSSERKERILQQPRGPLETPPDDIAGLNALLSLPYNTPLSAKTRSNSILRKPLPTNATANCPTSTPLASPTNDAFGQGADLPRELSCMTPPVPCPELDTTAATAGGPPRSNSSMNSGTSWPNLTTQLDPPLVTPSRGIPDFDSQPGNHGDSTTQAVSMFPSQTLVHSTRVYGQKTSTAVQNGISERSQGLLLHPSTLRDHPSRQGASPPPLNLIDLGSPVSSKNTQYPGDGITSQMTARQGLVVGLPHQPPQDTSVRITCHPIQPTPAKSSPTSSVKLLNGLQYPPTSTFGQLSSFPDITYNQSELVAATPDTKSPSAPADTGQNSDTGIDSLPSQFRPLAPLTLFQQALTSSPRAVPFTTAPPPSSAAAVASNLVAKPQSIPTISSQILPPQLGAIQDRDTALLTPELLDTPTPAGCLVSGVPSLAPDRPAPAIGLQGGGMRQPLLTGYRQPPLEAGTQGFDSSTVVTWGGSSMSTPPDQSQQSTSTAEIQRGLASLFGVATAGDAGVSLPHQHPQTPVELDCHPFDPGMQQPVELNAQPTG